MAKSNPHFPKLRREYIFPIIEKKLVEMREKYPAAEIINVGIGDVSLPLAPSIAKAINLATLEMTDPFSLKGYGPSEGYPFLRKAIAENDYKDLSVAWEEIFISDGINSDIANISELFHPKSVVTIPSPSYPVYLDANILAGRKVVLMPCLEASGCLPTVPEGKVDVIYLCSPSNPTGSAMTRKELTAFVEYALINQSVIIYDNAYSAFITSPDVPRSIYEIPRAKEVAIEFCSFSKSAGFTGLRCGFTVIPKELHVVHGKKAKPLWDLWRKRQSIKSNGVSYPIQRGALSIYSKEGKEETQSQVKSYLTCAKTFYEGLRKLGYTCYGGIDAPYVWWKVPSPYSSWEFFDLLLNKCHLIAIPGCGFGEYGEGFIRLSAFTQLEHVHRALERIQKLDLHGKKT